MKLLILHLTRDGQTQRIANHIEQTLASGANFAEICNLSLREHHTMPAETLAQFDAIIIGASIRYGHFDPLLTRFIGAHHALLAQKIGALFTVNLTARKAGKNTPATNVYTRKLLAKIRWQPQLCAVFAGGLYYPRYSWFDRIMIQFIMKITGGETDTRKEIDYTDWQQVANFAENFAILCKKTLA